MDAQNTTNKLYEMSILHNAYNKHVFDTEIKLENMTIKICKCGFLINNMTKYRIILDKNDIKKINKRFNLPEIDLIKHLVKVNKYIEIDYDLLSTLDKINILEILKIELENTDEFYYIEKIFYLLKDYLSINFFKKLNTSNDKINLYIKNFILMFPDNVSINKFNHYLNQVSSNNVYNLLSLDMNKIKQIKKIKMDVDTKTIFYNDFGNINDIYKDRYFFDKMYYIEKITGKQFIRYKNIDKKAMNEFRLFYIFKRRLYEIFAKIWLRAKKDGVNDKKSFIEYLIRNTQSEIDRQSIKLINIDKVNNAYVEKEYWFGNNAYQYDCDLSKINELYKYT